MVASTKTDVALGTVAIPHEGPEEYNNIWQKVRSMWSYIYDNYYEKVRIFRKAVSLWSTASFNISHAHFAVRLFSHWRRRFIPHCGKLEIISRERRDSTCFEWGSVFTERIRGYTNTSIHGP
jgi:hypothetical protein